MQGLRPLLALMVFHATVLISMNSRYALTGHCLYVNVQVSVLHFLEVLVMDTFTFQQIGYGNFSVVFKVLRRIEGCLYAVKRSNKQLHNDMDR
jgi:hypothetical protein